MRRRRPVVSASAMAMFASWARKGSWLRSVVVLKRGPHFLFPSLFLRSLGPWEPTLHASF